MMQLSIVIPCYNEAKNLPALITGYRAALGERSGIEIILVDNGSKDDTPQVIAEQLRAPENVAFRTVRVEVNQGYGYGIMQGLKAARGEFCGWSHADQQCPPEDAFRLMDAMLATGQPEKCFGKGFRTNDRGNAAFLTRAQAKLARLILGAQLEEINAQPKIFPRRFFDGFRLAPSGFELDIYAYYKAVREGYRIVNIDVHFLERVHGQSNWAYSLSSRLRFILRNTKYLFFLRINRGRL